MYRRIRDLREDRDMTQAQMGRILACSQRVYSNYERGKRTPSLDVIMDLASFYKVPFTYFLNSENLDLIAASKEPPVLPLTPPEQQLMDIYRSLSSERREQLVEFALFLQNQP